MAASLKGQRVSLWLYAEKSRPARVAKLGMDGELTQKRAVLVLE